MFGYFLRHQYLKDRAKKVMSRNWPALNVQLGDQQKMYSDVREAIFRKMTPQQIAEEQRLAREWRPSK
jgi:hypothetical protein